MQWIDLERQQIVDDFGTRGVSMLELARVADATAFGVHVSSCEPGGVLGRHAGRMWQLFCVISGSGWVSGEDRIRHDIEAGRAVVWSPAESHESGSEIGMTVVIVQSTVPLPTNGG